MVELSIRLLIAAGAILTAGWLGRPDFDVAWKVGALVAVYAVLAYRMDLRDLRNPGLRGFVAVADAFAIAFLATSAGVAGEFGFLVLAPCAYAAARFGSQPAAMAPLAGAALLCAASAVGEPGSVGVRVLAQAGAVLGVGLLLNHRRIVMTVTRPIEPVSETPQHAAEPDGYLELRENFRKLRDAYHDLERKSRRDRLIAQLQEAKLGRGERFLPRLAARIQELTGAQSVALYTVAQFAEKLVLRTVTGDVPEELRTHAFEVDLERAPGQVRHAVGALTSALLSEADRAKIAQVVLTEGGAVSGMMVVSHDRPGHLDEARERAEELAPYVAALLRDRDEREQADRRLRETEILYETAVASVGAETPLSLCARVAKRSTGLFEADHFGVFLLEEGEAMAAAHAGRAVRLLEALEFESGSGVEGWLACGAPELAMHDLDADPRCPPREALKRRVHSFCLVPLRYGSEPCGFVTVASQVVGGVDVRDLEVLHTVAAELSLALGRLIEGAHRPEGLVTVPEFQHAVQGATEGALVHIELLRVAELVERFGAPAVEQAVGVLMRKLRDRLPLGAALCRREGGDLVVFLRGMDAAFAQSWANEATTYASLVPLSTPDGSETIPLAVRAKAAALTRQSGGILGETAA
ncbi:MAG: GAF domain-containing protein [Fimbriimonadaceae bacterium]|nr:GAF domain-containing protein [Chthonomonadaceae bacterium]MCO5295675.1 GAF domain-containing protein [Fimbriimonadaceae bacterium]